MGDSRVRFVNRNYRKEYQLNDPSRSIKNVKEYTTLRDTNTNKTRSVKRLSVGNTRRNNAGILNRSRTLRNARSEASQGINYRALAHPSIALARGELNALVASGQSLATPRPITSASIAASAKRASFVRPRTPGQYLRYNTPVVSPTRKWRGGTWKGGTWKGGALKACK